MAKNPCLTAKERKFLIKAWRCSIHVDLSPLANLIGNYFSVTLSPWAKLRIDSAEGIVSVAT